VYIKTNKETQTTTDIQNKTRYPPRFGRLLRHSASIRRRFMLQIPTPNSASEMTYIVSGGALNSTTLKGLPCLRIHHCASYSKQRYKGKGKVRRKPPQRRCTSHAGPAFSLGHSPSPRSRTLACSHTRSWSANKTRYGVLTTSKSSFAYGRRGAFTSNSAASYKRSIATI